MCVHLEVIFKVTYKITSSGRLYLTKLTLSPYITSVCIYVHNVTVNFKSDYQCNNANGMMGWKSVVFLILLAVVLKRGWTYKQYFIQPTITQDMFTMEILAYLFATYSYSHSPCKHLVNIPIEITVLSYYYALYELKNEVRNHGLGGAFIKTLKTLPFL